MRYWRTYRKTLIQDLLNAAKERGCKFIMWQQYGSNRKVYNVSLDFLAKNEVAFSVDKNSLAKTGAVNPDQPVYFHVKDMDIIFKKAQYNYFGAKLKSTPPNELQVYEKRRGRRFYYKYQDHKNITFESAARREDGSPEFTLSCVLVDISTSGAGMAVSRKGKDRMHEGMELNLMNLTDQKLPEPFSTRVKYIQRYSFKDDPDLYKVGLEFADELDSVSYKSINSVIEKKAKRVEGLDRERFCGLDLEEQYKLIGQIEVNNKALANNIKDANDYLDRLRYMTTKMKIEFLQSVSHELLATALRLSSKELIYDLFIELTVNIREDFLEKLGREKPPSAINKAQDEIISFLRKKEATGEFVLDPSAFDTYV